MKNEQPEFYSWQQAADFLQVTTRTLGRWHAEGIGPPRIKLKRKVLYSKQSLVSWLKGQEKPACRT